MNARHVVFELRDKRQVEIANSQEGQEFGIEEVPAEATGASMGSHHSASWEGSELGGGGVRSNSAVIQRWAEEKGVSTKH